MTWLAYSHLGVPKAVQLTTQPAGALAGIAFTVQPVGRLIDGGGVLSRTTGATVTSSKAGGVGTLSGTLSVQTAEGVFTFTDLKMDTVTSAVTLSFASSGLTSATSNPFNVTQPNTIIGCEVGTYTTTGTAATLDRTRVCQCVSGSYAITGTAATLTYSGGLYPNQPAGYTSGTRLLNFSQAVPTGATDVDRPIDSDWSMTYDVIYGDGTRSATKITDPTAPVDDDVWEMHFAPGTFGSSHGVGIIYTALPNPHHLYVSLYFKYSDSYPWHPISNKFLWWSSANGDPYFIQSNTQGRWLAHENNSVNQFLDPGLGLLQGATLLTYSNAPITNGWHHVESILDLDAHTWRTWLDGTLRMDATGVQSNGGSFVQFVLEAYRGGGGETLAVDCYNYWDNIHLAW